MSEVARPGGTYQTLDEQREKLSPAEERFERARQTIGLFLGPLVFLAMYFAPLPLAPAQQTLAAILLFVIVYGSGMIPITKMVRSGVVFDIIGAILIVAGVTVMAQVVGLV